MGEPSTSGETFEPAIAGFFCEKCGKDCLGEANELPVDFPPHLKSIRLMCAEKVTAEMIQQAFENGVDGVLICGCLVGKCQSAGKNAEVLAQIHQGKMVLRKMGLPPGRLRQEWICGPHVDHVRAIVEEFAEQIRPLGPLHGQAPTVFQENE
jgi:F420-non-reducing hydrogenase iron-sulfur subunit